MTNHRVDGLLVPDQVAGCRAIEIANTRAGWGGPAPREYLTSYDVLAVWAGDAGLLSAHEVAGVRKLAARSPRAADAVLAETLALRDACYAVLTAPAAPAEAYDAVRAAAAACWAASTLRVGPDGGVRPDGGPVALRLPLHRVARDAVELLAAGDAPYVRACGGDGCGWLFLDRARRRRWCTMAICGNRAKARAYAARHR